MKKALPLLLSVILILFLLAPGVYPAELTLNNAPTQVYSVPTAVHASLNDYLELIPDPSSFTLRNNLWTKMNHICNVRTARGAIYGPGD